MKGVLPLLVLVSLCMFLVSCLEQEPAEISIIAKLDGQQHGCTCQLYNSKGNQISEMSTDFNGIGYFRAVPPGTYTIKFTDAQYNPYPAQKTVTIQAGESLPVQVELNEAPATPTDTAPAE